MSKELLAPGGLTELSVIKILLCDDPGAFQELNMNASSWPQKLYMFLICLWLCNCGTEGLI